MKKLYALLIILIVIYVGINVGSTGLNIPGLSDSNATADSDNDADINGDFPKLDNFTQSKIKKNAVSYVDNNRGVNITVQRISNSQNVSSIYNNLSSGNSYTSSQDLDQKGVTTYFLYNEGSDSYSTDIYFNKNGQNYKISGNNITYENSDYFINSCKKIVDMI